MSRSLRLYLDDILKSLTKIQSYTTQMSQEQLVADERTFDAVIHNLQIIGEASKNIPDDLRNRYNSIDWKKIIGLRNIIVHTYFSVDDEIVWDIIQTKLAPLKSSIETILEQESLDIE
ncbi:DUF86 domain-containing protein [Roseofilum sp. BLCC_M154]|uniref:DUF86 domain-containing protein n=1 Tax=Roseofilum acuticapitatum BLCC-M154 TaxID=3022444 RepID=A0ABT7AN23_9CYAN|nr:DUF86 domain-containing protein [Roseofilum acuticapitatum]MDJ1168294.1 DUF86 domain-containing protein [Roseofilum acuticapitatum BLCC-M154]